MAVTLLGTWCLLTLHVPVAHACGALACTRVNLVVVPAAAQVVPANSPGLALLAGCARPVRLDLLGAQGDELATAVAVGEVNTGEVALALTTPLTPGESYRLRGLAETYGDLRFDGGPTETVAAFTAGPAAPLPTTLGAIRVTYAYTQVGSRQGMNPSSPPSPARPISPTAEPDAVVASLVLEPSLEMAAFAPLIRYTTWVDDAGWAGTPYGRGFVNADVEDRVTLRDVTRIHAPCGRVLSGAACEPVGASLGRHTVRVQAHLAGAAVDPPPITVEIDLKCPGDGGVEAEASPEDGGSTAPAASTALDASTGPEASRPPPAASADAAADIVVARTTDAGWSDDAPAPMEPRAAAPGALPRGGCSVAAVASTGRACWSTFGAAGLGALVAYRRRRRQSGDDRSLVRTPMTRCRET